LKASKARHKYGGVFKHTEFYSSIEIKVPGEDGKDCLHTVTYKEVVQEGNNIRYTYRPAYTSWDLFCFLKPYGTFAVSIEMNVHILTVLGTAKWVVGS
jgi:hypothetical protein